MAVDLVLCADDFGITAGVNHAILALLAKKRLSAVSCMTLTNDWKTGACELEAYRGEVAVGLHLTLTTLPPLPSLSSLIVRSELHLLDRKKVFRALELQFEHFMAVWGAPPDFIDGHQHVHVLPIIRSLLLELRQRYSPNAWVRNVADRTALCVHRKALPLFLLGYRCKELLRCNKIPHNLCLRGAYTPRPAAFAAQMGVWIKKPCLIYCHPGFPDAALAACDPFVEPRREEYAFLQSDLFASWLQERITLVRRP